ncbi:MAG: glycosyltransferase family 4 protein [Ignavibacteriales bacterium]|nr:glycosyltransferase family 4 protein [Ignavibacteriales bacterium]
MRVLNIAGDLKTGGVSTIIKSLIMLNSEFENQYDLLLFNDYKTKEFENCKIWNLSGKLLTPIVTKNILSNISKQYDAFIIHAPEHKILPNLIFTGKKCLVFQHGMALSKNSLIKKIAKKILLNSLSLFKNVKIICSSEHAIKKMRSYGIWIPKSKIFIVNFGIDLSEVKLLKTNKKNCVTIGTAGILSKIKRFDLLLEALLHYSNINNLVIKIAGEGPESSNLKILASKVNSKNVKIEFLGNVDDMHSFYSSLDLFVFPSHNESFGLVVAEALKYKLPIICFDDLGGALALVKHNENGIILKDKINGLKNFLNTLDTKFIYLEKMRDNISVKELTKYDIKNTRRTIDLLLGK